MTRESCVQIFLKLLLETDNLGKRLYYIISFQHQIVQALTNAGLSVSQSSSRKRKRSDDDAGDFASSNHKREFVDKNDSIILIE